MTLQPSKSSQNRRKKANPAAPPTQKDDTSPLLQAAAAILQLASTKAVAGTEEEDVKDPDSSDTTEREALKQTIRTLESKLKEEKTRNVQMMRIKVAEAANTLNAESTVAHTRSDPAVEQVRAENAKAKETINSLIASNQKLVEENETLRCKAIDNLNSAKYLRENDGTKPWVAELLPSTP